MLTCVFILGRPGSGKSSIAQQIVFILRHYGWDVEYLYDYQLLQKLFLIELDNLPLNEKERRFIPRGPQGMYGFDVFDFSVLDEVLQDIATKATGISQHSPLHKKSLLLIEFARNNYQKALSLFDHALLQDAHILYVETDLETCIERIGRRLDNQSQYSHFVSIEIMRRYYYKDDWLEGRIEQYLKDLGALGIRTFPHYIANTSTSVELSEEVDKFIKLHLLHDTETEAIPILQDTEAIPIVSPKPFQIESAK